LERYDCASFVEEEVRQCSVEEIEDLGDILLVGQFERGFIQELKLLQSTFGCLRGVCMLDYPLVEIAELFTEALELANAVQQSRSDLIHCKLEELQAGVLLQEP